MAHKLLAQPLYALAILRPGDNEKVGLPLDGPGLYEFRPAADALIHNAAYGPLQLDGETDYRQQFLGLDRASDLNCKSFNYSTSVKYIYFVFDSST